MLITNLSGRMRVKYDFRLAPVFGESSMLGWACGRGAMYHECTRTHKTRNSAKSRISRAVESTHEHTIE